MCTDCAISDHTLFGKQFNWLHTPDDPIVKFEGLFNLQFPMKNQPQEYKSITSSFKRKHQTLVVVCVKADPHPIFMERAIRFVTSLNLTATIKADIVSLSDGKLFEGLIWIGDKPGGMTEKQIADFSMKHGYSQYTVLHFTGEQ